MQHCCSILPHCSWQIIYNPSRLWGSYWKTCNFKILNKFPMGFESEDWWGHTESSWVIVAVCLWSLSWWNVHLLPKFSLRLKSPDDVLCPNTTTVLHCGYTTLGIICAALLSPNMACCFCFIVPQHSKRVLIGLNCWIKAFCNFLAMAL